MNSKTQLRSHAYQSRNNQQNKDYLSQVICDKFIAQSAYQQADTIMWYLHCRSEVRTLSSVITQLNTTKKIIIPYCTKNDRGENILGLWWLEDMTELSTGTWGILEPPKARWGEKGKEITPTELDLIMVPGVAFDRHGGRLGNGAGYYDHLLNKVRTDTQLTAVCYESQLYDKVIMDNHDIYMDTILTELNTFSIKKNGL